MSDLVHLFETLSPQKKHKFMKIEGEDMTSDPFETIPGGTVVGEDAECDPFATKPTIATHVAGIPRPKGSMRVVDRQGHMQEDNPRSKPWRQQVVSHLERFTNFGNDEAGGFPIPGPVEVRLVFMFDRPKSSKNDHPVTMSVGDVDKLSRNILDAMQDAKVYHNDSQVIRLIAEKCYVIDGFDTPGVEIAVTEVQ